MTGAPPSGRLEVEGLVCGFPGRRVLEGVSFACPPGSRLAVLGRSGAGKTTLLRAVAGLHAPAAGAVRLDGAEATLGPRLLVPPEARRVGLVFQELALWSHLSVEGTLTFAGRGTRGERRRRARELAVRVGLGDRLDAFPDDLSGGERQRLALARALAAEPRVLLLDEPFAHLDPPLRRHLGGVLLDLVTERAVTLVLVTHHAEDALDLAEQLLVLEAGRAVEEGPVAAVAAAPRSAVTVELLRLGQLLPGTVRGGRLATALGPVALEGEAPEGAERAALLRPGQLRARPTGDAGGPGAVGVVRRLGAAADGSLRGLVALPWGLELEASLDAPAPAGGEVRLEVQGPCHLLPERPKEPRA